MAKLVSVVITKTVEISSLSEIWQLSDEQLREAFTDDWEDWDSVDTQLLIVECKEETDE